MAVSWFVYIARCADATLYTGIATDVGVRIHAHNIGRGARYTRGRGPLVVCARRRCANKGDALRLEYALKQLERAEKERLIRARGLPAFAKAALRPGPPRSRKRKVAGLRRRSP